jgi:hypothetical protein
MALGGAVLLQRAALSMVSLLPRELVVRGEYRLEGEPLELSLSGLGHKRSWSVRGVREGTKFRGALILPGHEVLEGVAIEATLANGVVEGVIVSQEGEIIGYVWGRWNLDSAAGGYTLESGETGNWSWSRRAPLAPAAEASP